MGMFNRATRRAVAKAVRCIKSGTKVPGGIRAKLDPRGLDAIAASMSRKIGKGGQVLPLAA